MKPRLPCTRPVRTLIEHIRAFEAEGRKLRRGHGWYHQTAVVVALVGKEHAPAAYDMIMSVVMVEDTLKEPLGERTLKWPEAWFEQDASWELFETRGYVVRGCINGNNEWAPLPAFVDAYEATLLGLARREIPDAGTFNPFSRRRQRVH